MALKKVFVNGTFDLLHRGHVELLKYARSLYGDAAWVWVAIDSDARVKQLKGADRPIVNEADRAFILKSLKYVDLVVIFNTDDELRSLLKVFKPEVMVKGSDYANQPIIGAEHCGEIKFFDRLPNYATSKTIQDLADR